MRIWKQLKNTLTNKVSLTSHEPKGIGVLRDQDQKLGRKIKKDKFELC